MLRKRALAATVVVFLGRLVLSDSPDDQIDFEVVGTHDSKLRGRDAWL